jgi:prepilin-type N-terminal cleavage/methylation domain-containing protein
MLKSKGFTLVEISIVLVIIGLILGAVFVGAQVLIATTKNTGTVTLIKDLSGAIIGFKSRYHYLPGDLPSAAQDIQNISTGATGCDIVPPFAGIGNGLIDANEQKCVVEELVLSGFMKGSSSAPGFISPLNQGTTPDVIVLSAIASSVNTASIINPLVKASLQQSRTLFKFRVYLAMQLLQSTVSLMTVIQQLATSRLVRSAYPEQCHLRLLWM